MRTIREKRARELREKLIPEWTEEPFVDRLERCVKMLCFHGILGETVSKQALRRIQFLRETGD